MTASGLHDGQYEESETRQRRDGGRVDVRTVGILTRPTWRRDMSGARERKRENTYNSSLPIPHNLLKLDRRRFGRVD